MHKKQFVVTKATTREGFDGIDIDGKKHMFAPGRESFILDDKGKADELNKTYGLGKGGSKEITVSEIDDRRWQRQGHTYMFGTHRLGNWKERIDWGHD